MASVVTKDTYNKIIKQFISEDGCSDLHIRGNEKPYFRINGTIRPELAYESLAPEHTKGFIEYLIDIRYNQDVAEKVKAEVFHCNKELDMSIAFDNNTRARVNAFLNNGNWGATLRKIPKEIPSIEQLGFYPEHIAKIDSISNKKEGLILITGQTGSGKSTTLAAIIKLINESRERHVITIEDPIEFYHHNNKCLITHREVGAYSDTQTFATGIRAALREDPDIILIGELRDPETAMTAIQAAQTGHIVLATLHTNSVAESITRLVDMFPADRAKSVKSSLASSLAMIVSQRLLPNNIGKRTLAYEMLLNNSGIASLINEDIIQTTRIIEKMTQNMSDGGMLPLNYCLKRLILDKDESRRISKDIALEYSYDKSALETLTKDIASAMGNQNDNKPSSKTPVW